MYKIGDKLKLSDNVRQFGNFTPNIEYEIASQRLQDRKFVIFDNKNNPEYLDEKELSYYFILVEEIKNSNNKLKNTKASHYNLWLDTDSIDIIKANLTQEEYIGALKFNILKYQLRLGKKDCIESDMEKIEDYKRELNSILGVK